MILTPCIPYYNSASYDGLYFEGEETGAQETLSLKAKISLSITGKAKLTPTVSPRSSLLCHKPRLQYSSSTQTQPLSYYRAFLNGLSIAC